MRKILLILGLCFASTALAQDLTKETIYNNNLGTAIYSANLQSGITRSVDAFGAQYVNVVGAASSKSIGRPEDDVFSSGDMTVISSGQREDTLSSSQAGNNRVSNSKYDTVGRQYVNAFGAGVGEWFNSCGTATATTSDVAIKAAVASNRMYVTWVSCKNSSTTVSTNIDIKDGTTVIAVGGVGALVSASGTSGSTSIPFPTPLRLSVNTALNFATNSSTTSVVCCAGGFISVN